MASEASRFLDAWVVARENKAPMTRGEAEALARDWSADAAQNGIDAAELDEAAGGDLADYLLRVFGEAGPEESFPTPAR